jgi:SAM-dependent methyltransferase
MGDARVELLIGCGNSRKKKLNGPLGPGWSTLVTLDIDPGCEPDVVHDIGVLPLPFRDDMFDEIHAYDVLEHSGVQGDWKFFFAQFDEFWRILKPGGWLIGMSPAPTSPWAWGDPGHTRIISAECLTFLNRPEYVKQVGKTAMTDYRPYFKCDFNPNVQIDERTNQLMFALEAVKPAR